MKKLKLAVMALTVGLFTLTSCSDDDTETVAVRGTWELTNAKVATAVDLDSNGDSPSTELKNEPLLAACLDGVRLVFSNEGSATAGTVNYVAFNRVNISKSAEGYEVSCSPDYDNTNGTWSRLKNKVTVQVDSPNPQADPIVLVLQRDGDHLTGTIANGYKVFNNETMAYEEQQDVEVIFTKR